MTKTSSSNLRSAYVSLDVDTRVYSLCVDTLDGSPPHVLQTSANLDPGIQSHQYEGILMSKATQIALILDIEYNNLIRYTRS